MQSIMDQRLFCAHLKWVKLFQSDLCSELDIAKYGLHKGKEVALSSPERHTRQRILVTALAVYAPVEMKQLDLEAIKVN